MNWEKREPTNEEIKFLKSHGLTKVEKYHQWVFEFGGLLFDLSAADLNQIERIINEKLCLMDTEGLQ
jgi:hypothetical protein